MDDGPDDDARRSVRVVPLSRVTYCFVVKSSANIRTCAPANHTSPMTCPMVSAHASKTYGHADYRHSFRAIRANVYADTTKTAHPMTDDAVNKPKNHR